MDVALVISRLPQSLIDILESRTWVSETTDVLVVAWTKTLSLSTTTFLQYQPVQSSILARNPENVGVIIEVQAA